jgi:hypothetical protein
MRHIGGQSLRESEMVGRRLKVLTYLVRETFRGKRRDSHLLANLLMGSRITNSELIALTEAVEKDAKNIAFFAKYFLPT